MDNPAIYEELKGAQCGGGYTDKYGLSWQAIGPYPDCKYYPFLQEGNFSTGELEPPKDDDRIYFNGVSCLEIIRILKTRPEESRVFGFTDGSVESNP